MGFTFPFTGLMRVIGGMILLSTIFNALLYLQQVSIWGQDLYSSWYFAWSALFLFVGVLLVVASLWQDPRIVVVVSCLIALLWHVYIVLGGF